MYFILYKLKGPALPVGKMVEKILNKTKINWEKKFEFLLAYDTPDRP